MPAAMSVAPRSPNARPHHVGCRRGGPRQAVRAEHAQADDVDEQVEQRSRPRRRSSRPRGRSRRGGAARPHTKLAVCQPPYANSTGTSAAPNAGAVVVAAWTSKAVAWRAARKPNADEHRHGAELEHHQHALRVAAAADAEAVDDQVRTAMAVTAMAPSERQPGQLANSARTSTATAAMPPLCDDQQQRPAVEERRQGMKRVAQVRVLPAHRGPQRGQLRVDERAGQRDRRRHRPGAER